MSPNHHLPNHRLRAERERQGLTQQELAELLQAREIETTTKELAVDAHSVWRWEAGLRRPSKFYAERIAAVLGKSRAELGLVDERAAPWSSNGDREQRRLEEDEDVVTVPILTADGRIVEVSISRRRFLQTGGVAFAELGLNTGSTLRTWTAKRVGAEEVRQVRIVLPQLVAMDDAFGGGKVVPLAVDQLRRVQRLINEATFSEEVGRELHSAAGEVAELAGWLSFDAGRHDEARSYFNEALTMARLAEDKPLTTLTLARMSLQSTDLNRPREALNMMRLAHETASGWASPKATSLLHTREARALAKMGDARGCRRALTQARRQLDRSNGDEEEPRIHYFDHAQLAHTVGIDHAYLGDHQTAVPYFRESLANLRPSFVRNRVQFGSELAGSLLSIGEIEEGCYVAGQALDQLPEVSSGRVIAFLKGVTRGIPASAAGTPAVKDLTDRLTAAGIA